MVIKAALDRSRISPDLVDEVFMGCVCTANLGQAPTTQAMIKAGLPCKIPCTGINKVCEQSLQNRIEQNTCPLKSPLLQVCASGLKAVMLADQTIRLGTFK